MGFAIAGLVTLLAIASVNAQAPTASVIPSAACTRAGILQSLSKNPDIATTLQAITTLKLTSLLPDKAGTGTFFVPKNLAYAATGVPPTALLTTLKNQTATILVYHSLLGQGKTLSRSLLVKSSPIPSDLSLIAGALAIKGKYDLTIVPSPGGSIGRETVRGVNPKNTALIRGVLKICGYYFYPIDSVLIPANSIMGVPAGPGAALLAAVASGANLDSPGGLAAGIVSKAVVLPPAAAAAAAAAAASDTKAAAADTAAAAAAMAPGASAALGPGGAAAAGPGAAAAAGGVMSPLGAPMAGLAPESAMSATNGVAGAALPLNGTGGTLSSSNPVLLEGVVTSKSGSKTVGPGLVYLDGTVQDGVGVAGTATAVDMLNKNGATLSGLSIPLAGAVISGSPFAAEGIKIISAAMGPGGAMAMGPGGAMAMGPGGAMSALAPGASSSSVTTGFGEALKLNKDGTITNKGPMILDGTVKNGTALDAMTATGTAAQGSLGPGAIYVDGDVMNGKGVSGKAYPIVSLGTDAIAVNQDNGVNIKGATISGKGFVGTGIKPKLQSASGPGGAGAASAGSPGVTAPGQRSSVGAAGAAAGAAAPAAAPGTTPGVAKSSASTASASLLAVASAVAVVVFSIV